MVAFHWGRAFLLPPAAPLVEPLLPAVYPDAQGFTGREGSPPRRTAWTLGPDGGRVAVGAVVESADYAPGVRGYAGPVPLLVGVAADGTITGVAMLPNHETPSYAARLAHGPFLRQFAGRGATDALRLDEDVDGVTRATVTAAAVTEGVRRSARAAARSIHGLAVPPDDPPPPLPWLRVGTVAATVALGAASLVVPLPALRWASLLGGLAVLGWWQGTYLSALALANVLLGRWPAVREQMPWYLLLGASLLAAVAWRNLWCTRLCPFGALQELLRLLFPGRLAADPGEERDARRLRVTFLWLATAAVFLFGRAEAANYEPFSTAFDFRGGPLRWTLLGVVLVLATQRHRFWCRYFCPTGTCLQLLGRMRTATPFEERRERGGGVPGGATEPPPGDASPATARS